MTVPGNLKYTPEHHWVKLEPDGTVTTGITGHAQAELGDIVYVQPPEAGRRVRQGEACGVVESVKTAADLHAPVSGEVIAVNAALGDDPARVNTDPYGAWIFRMRVEQSAEIAGLLEPDAYAKLIA